MIAFDLVFAAGVVPSASPCALATVPLVVGYVGGHAGDSKPRAFFYSLAFVLGLATTFTALGAAAALLGQLMGSLGGPWFVALLHCVLMLAAGTFAGLVSAWAQSRGMMAFSLWLKRVLGLLLVAAGGYLVWLA